MSGQRRIALCALCLEVALYLTAALLVAGHVVNRLVSPRPLNPLWNRISTFAASRYGGHFVSAGIVLFAICLLGFGLLASRLRGRLFKPGSFCVALSSIPMTMIAWYPIFAPNEQAGAGGARLPHTLAEIASNRRHYASSMIAFGILIAGMVMLSLSFLREAQTKSLGRLGLILLPPVVALFVMTYASRFYNGTWQRAAFLLVFAWIVIGVRRIRGATNLVS